MKTQNLLTTMLLFVAGLCLSMQTMASPLVDTLNVQGYMKKANGTAVTDGAAYSMVYGVFQNGTALWAQQISTTITNGLFSASLNGNGTNLLALPPGTGMKANYAGLPLTAALLSAATAGEVSIRVYSITTIDGANPQFDIALGAVPTSMVAALAQGVEAGSVALAGIAATSKSNVGGGANAGKLGLLDGSGLFDLTMIPALPASQIGSGQVGIGNGGTGSSTGSITGSGSVTYMSAAGSTTAIGNNAGASILVLQSGTGGISQTVTGTTGNIAMTAGSTSGAISLTPGTTSGTVTVGSGTSSGASTFGNAGGASATTVQSGTGHILLSPAGVGLVRVTNGNGLNLVNGTGSITVNSPLNPTSYTLMLPSSAGSANQFMMTDGSGNASWSSVNVASLTGTLPIANGGTNSSTALAGNKAMVSNGTAIVESATTATELGYVSGVTSAIQTQLNGKVGAGLNTTITGLNPTGVLAIGGAATTAVNVLPTGLNAAVSVASNGSGLLTVGGAGTGAAVFGNSGAASTTTVQSGSAGNIFLSPVGTGLVEFTNANGFKLDNGAGNIIVSAPLNPTSWSMVLPSSAGSGNQVLMTDGFGTTSWATLSVASSISGTLPVANGGTNSATALNDNRVMVSSAGKIVETAAITANRALASNASGIPVAVATTDTELGYVNGVTSAIQTQLNAKASSGANSSITSMTAVTSITSSAGLSLASAAAGATTVGDNTGAASTTIQSGTGNVILAPAGAGRVQVTNANGLALVNGAGNVNVSAPLNPTSWSMVLPSTAGSTGQVLTTDGFGTTSWSPVAVSGTVAVANGGTNSTTALNNNRVMVSSAGKIVEATAVTGNKALASDVNGIPVASATTDTELGYVSGVTSAIQTQLNAKAGTGANSSITSMTAVTSVASSAGLTLTSVAGGSTILGDNTGAASTTVRSGTGGTLVTSTGTTATAVNLTATGAGGGITLTSGSGGILLDPASGNTVTIGNTGGGATTIQSPTANVANNLGIAATLAIGGVNSTFASTVNVGVQNGTTTGVPTTNIGTNATLAGATPIVNIGNVSNTGSTTVNIGNQTGITTGVATTNIALNSGALGTAPVVNLGKSTSTGTVTVNIGTATSTGAVTTNIGAGGGAAATNVNINSSPTLASTTTIGASSLAGITNTTSIGGLTGATTAASAIDIGVNASTSTGISTTTIGNLTGAGSGSQVVSIGNNTTGAAGSIVTTTLGQASTATTGKTVVIIGGTTGVLNTGTNTLTAGNNANTSTGTMTSTFGGVSAGAGTGANVVNIGVNNGTGNSANTINIGNGTNATALGTQILIGNTTSAGSTVKFLGGTAFTRAIVTCNFASTNAATTPGACAGALAAHKCACSVNVANTTTTSAIAAAVPTANTVTITWTVLPGGVIGNTSCLCW